MNKFNLTALETILKTFASKNEYQNVYNGPAKKLPKLAMIASLLRSYDSFLDAVIDCDSKSPPAHNVPAVKDCDVYFLVITLKIIPVIQKG